MTTSNTLTEDQVANLPRVPEGKVVWRKSPDKLSIFILNDHDTSIYGKPDYINCRIYSKHQEELDQIDKILNSLNIEHDIILRSSDEMPIREVFETFRVDVFTCIETDECYYRVLHDLPYHHFAFFADNNELNKFLVLAKMLSTDGIELHNYSMAKYGLCKMPK